MRDQRPVMQRNDLVVRFMCPSLVDLSQPGIRDQRRGAPMPSFEHASSDRHQISQHPEKARNEEGTEWKGGRKEGEMDRANDESDR